MADEIARIAAVISAQFPGADDDVVKTAILGMRGPPAPGRLPRLARFVEANPDFALNPAPGLPAMLQRLSAALHHAGLPSRLPRCQSCTHERVLLKSSRSGLSVCHSCRTYEAAETCSRCRRHRPIAAVIDGQRLCSPCGRLHPSRHTTCIKCGVAKPAVVRTGEGGICQACYVCPEELCGACGELKPVTARIGGSPRCAKCWMRAKRAPASCPACGELRVVAYQSPHDRAMLVCARCSGKGSKNACEDCGREDLQYGRRCQLCELSRRLNALFERPHPLQRTWVDAFESNLLGVMQPSSVLRWLGKRGTEERLRVLAARDRPLTHEDIDTLGDQRMAEHLRACLRTVGTLQPRDEILAQLERRCAQFLAADDTADAPALRAYMSWKVLPRLRRHSARAELTASMARHAGSRMRAAHKFHCWLAERGMDLAHATQPLVEEYQSLHPSPFLPGYLKWAAQTQRCSTLDLPSARHGPANVTMTDEQRWAWVKQLLISPDGGLPARLAGLLVLLFGQQLSRLAQLHIDTVSTHDGHTQLRLGPHPVRLPEPVARLVHELVPPHDGSVSAATSPWLFPGKYPGTHTTVNALSHELTKLGLNTTQARNAALIALAKDVPSPVLADASGIAAATASRWAELAGERCQTYPAARRATTQPNE